MQVGRLSYKCRCGAWRWCDRAEELGEAGCNKCGTSFGLAAVEFWGTGAPTRSREPSRHNVQQRYEGSAATGGKSGPKGMRPGGKGVAGKGSTAGPKTPGIQELLPKGNGKGAGPQERPTGNVVSYNKNKFKSDPVYAAQSWLEMARTIHGEHSTEAEEAAKKVTEAVKAADERRTPAEKATRLRADRSSYIDEIAKGVHRLQHLQLQKEEIEAEMGKLDSEHRLALERIHTLDEKISMFELDAGLHNPLQPGGQVSQKPSERAQSRILDLFKPLQKDLEESGTADIQEKRKKLEIALGVLQNATMELMRKDAEMEDPDVLNKSDSELEDGEPRHKSAKKEEAEETSADMEAEEEWTTVLGPQARRAKKEHKLAQKSLQEITRKIQMSSSTRQPQSSSIEKGKGKGKSTGKGKVPIVLRPAADPSTPTVLPSRWEQGPPLSAGTGFPLAGALWSATAASSSSGATPSATAPSEAAGTTERIDTTYELSEGEWKEMLANRGGDGHLS